MNRFDYVKYDEKSTAIQGAVKEAFVRMEEMINLFPEGRNKALAMTKLEECYMWCGKSIRDAQVSRNGSAELQEERCNS